MNRWMIVIAVAVSLLSGCASTGSNEKLQVTLEDESFSLAGNRLKNMQVSQGSVMIFKNKSKAPHDLYASTSSEKFNLGLSKPGDVQEYKFDNKGRIPVRCSIHPNMELWVRVR